MKTHTSRVADRSAHGRLVIAPESATVGAIVRSVEEAEDKRDCILVAHRLDFTTVNRVLRSRSVSAIVVGENEFSDHARKMLQEAGIALVVHPDVANSEVVERCVVDRNGVTLLEKGVRVSAICSVLNARNLAAYQKFGVQELGYFRFKFCLFQLFAEEPEAYADPERVEEYLFARLKEVGEQHWESIRCVLSDPTSAELAEVGIDVVAEVNPDLGLRGPRVMSRWRAELAAIRRFIETTSVQVQICAPFVSTVEEYLEFAQLVADVGIDRSAVELGFTLEVPMLAESLDELFSEARVDFMGIGTSDLFALYNAVDRNNHALNVPTDSPGNLNLLRRVVSRAQANGVTTFVCGDIRRNEAIMTELLANGVNELICSARIDELTTVSRLSTSANRTAYPAAA